MRALVLLRLPSGLWSLVAVPDSQHVATTRGAARREVVREVLAAFGRVPLLAPLSAVGGRS